MLRGVWGTLKPRSRPEVEFIPPSPEGWTAPLGLSPWDIFHYKHPLFGKGASGWHRKGPDKEATVYINTLVRFGEKQVSPPGS